MAILNVDEPKELRFSSLPNITFQAIPSGNIDYERLTRRDGKGTINFIIADGLAYSKAAREFGFAKNLTAFGKLKSSTTEAKTHMSITKLSSRKNLGSLALLVSMVLCNLGKLTKLTVIPTVRTS